MKKNSLFLSVLIIVCSLRLYAGDYRPVTIIEANWGNGDGEFGLMREAEGNCPQAMAIDDQANLAILDAANRRVQMYNSDGEWIGRFAISSQAFDIGFENDRIVLLAPYDYVIEQYNLQGQIIEKTKISPKIEFIDGLRISDHKIFVQTVDQVQFNVSVRSQTKQLRSIQQGISSRTPGIRIQTRWIDPHRGDLLIDSGSSGKSQTISITTHNELGSIIFLDTDKSENIFIRKELFSNNGKPYFEVDKYDKDGQFLITVQIENENLVTPFKPITIDENGNIYFLEIKADGFFVIRWEEQN